jgi:transposase
MGGGDRQGYQRISREKLQQLLRSGPEAIFSLIEYQQDIIISLEQRIAELERQQKTDSSNSSKPPSSDGIAKRMYRPRQKSSRKPGGQIGHEGTTLSMVAHPDVVKIHRVLRCQHCNESLAENRVRGYVRRQVFDLPEIKMEVSEHRAEIKRCRQCGRQTVAEFPAGVEQRTQYGSRVQSFAVYLKNQGLLSYQRTAEVFMDLLGVSLSEGTLAGIDRRCARRLEPVVQEIKDRLLQSRVRHYDETGMSINGKLAWLHSTSTSEYTYYYPHPRRGSAATEEIGILGHGVPSVSVHDNWSNYFGYEGKHALCNAHQGRELKFLAEECDQRWAQRLHELLLEGKHRVDLANAAGRTKLSRGLLQRIHHRYEVLVGQGLRANPPPRRVSGGPSRGRIKKSKARNLAERLQRYRMETLRYLSDFSVPYDNNLAERDLRMMKVQQKISGTYRSTSGAMGFCRIRSLISTVKKQGASVIAALNLIFDGENDLSLSSCLQKG